ncbi:acetoacetate decarboxylase family protein [Streptomyces niger]|uniref:acetoacetate decarboxylase family protein n=1 Tax=Streptomyces niger TaxID=66373 RepID=UPI00069B7CB0|nr:acetoacetate decarboxylase family protein [Streptomyces niger]
MTDRTEPPAGPGFPAPPWRARGSLWLSLFRTRAPLPLPTGLTPLGSRRLLAVLLVRYTEGTLRYDEFAVASPVRSGRHVGLHCHGIWVDSEASLRGGRDLWGIPKEPARFSWSADSVRVSDDAGTIAALRVGPHGRWRVPVPYAPGHVFGRIGADRVQLAGRLSGRLRTGRLGALEWSGRLPELRRAEPFCALALSPARFFFPAGTVVDSRGGPLPGRPGRATGPDPRA